MVRSSPKRKEPPMTTASASTTTTAPATAPSAQPARWAIDPAHTSASFSVRHMMITNVRGEFRKLAGEVVFDPKRLDAVEVRASIETGSIDTREEARDAHLRSADFFDAEKHPAMTFVARRAQASRGGYELHGDLSIRGTTRPVTLAVTDVTAEHVDPWGKRRIGASATAKIRRSEFGMTWNAALEAGGILVGDEVTIQLEVSLVKQG